MEISNPEGEIPIPLNSTYVGGGGGVLGDGHHGHLIHHHHDPPPLNQIIPSTAPPQVPSNGIFNMSNNNNNNLEIIEQASSYKKLVKYKECLKNHAASMGGNATDGCGEFMPSGEEGTIEAIKCSACNCHRNFHRKEIEGEQPASSFDTWPHPNGSMQGRKFILGPHHKNVLTCPEAVGYPTPTTSFIPSRSAPHPHHMIMSYNMGGSQLPSESDEQEDGGGGGGSVVVPSRYTVQLMKKRFRTKFTQDQKEKMFNFAEKVGWKIQKQEESVVQHFCQEIGVKRRVLKVWMHNNKHNLAKKNALLSDI